MPNSAIPPLLHIDVQGRMGTFEVDAQISAGPGVTALFGRSGAGKSTIIAMTAGLIAPQRGRIHIAGETLFDSSANINLPPEKRGVGYVFQDARLFPHMSVTKNLLYGADGRNEDFDRVVGLLGLDELLSRRPGKLSGGEKQRVAIGRALLSRPRVLLMDEPLASLDAARKAEILPYIERLSRDFQIPVLYVSHAVDEVVRLADTLALIDAGTVKAQGTVEDIMGRLDLAPLTGRYEAGAVLSARVTHHDADTGLTHLDVQGHTFYAPVVDVEVGAHVRLRVRARDVALALHAPDGTSILNQLPARITEIREHGPSHVEIALCIEAPDGTRQPLHARITRKSFHDLKLGLGATVHALIKAVAIDRHSLGGLGTGARR